MPTPPKPTPKPTPPAAPTKPVSTDGTKVKINAAVLKRMCDVNQFVIPAGIDIVFLGIRGAVPEHNLYDKTFKYTTEANVILHDFKALNVSVSVAKLGHIKNVGKLGVAIYRVRAMVVDAPIAPFAPGESSGA